MPAACAELLRQGHPVHEVAVVGAREKVRRGWAVDHTNGREAAPSPARAGEGTDVAGARDRRTQDGAAGARGAHRVAEREGIPKGVGSAVAQAVTEACTNVVLHAYVDADVPGELQVRAWKADRALFVEVADDGRGLVSHIDSPSLGLGLPLIARMADVFELRTDRTRPGLVVRMQFNLDAPSEARR